MPTKWNVSPKEAVEIQHRLRDKIRLIPLEKKIKAIAGADVSMDLFGNTLYAGIIVLKFPSLETVEVVTAKTETNFPYIPGLLSFREIPALLKCVEKLSTKPDVFMVDGQGIAHPRRLGIASHLGVELGIPTIGVGKSVLYGKTEGERLIDPKSCEIIGSVIKTKPRTNPLIVSPGHLITLEESVEIVRNTLSGYKLPEPTRRAHSLVNDFRKGIINS
ncbi:endonuclease V [Candidatus Parcubacteria bacterium]|nr:endonuclease V [Candidatus Parcubacteria bacterium]